MNNIDTNKIKDEFLGTSNCSVPRKTILWQLINAVEILQKNQNELLEKIQELEYSANRLSSNECDCSVCRGNYE